MIGVIKRLSVNLPHDVLLKIYKYFIVIHLNYRDIIYDKPNNGPFFSIHKHYSHISYLQRTNTSWLKNKIENIQ